MIYLDFYGVLESVLPSAIWRRHGGEDNVFVVAWGRLDRDMDGGLSSAQL
ncbi:hypothetical protein DESC_740066 [Desulfosarcina cetonica]|nr:hypothetical protein DESC_740066 [Desulfosarcina cetonica]